jgi:hypothetical protein
MFSANSILNSSKHYYKGSAIAQVGFSLVPHHKDLGLLPGQSTKNLWLAEWHWDRFPQSSNFLPVTLSVTDVPYSPMYHVRMNSGPICIHSNTDTVSPHHKKYYQSFKTSIKISKIHMKISVISLIWFLKTSSEIMMLRRICIIFFSPFCKTY